jgi:hypothetical protein
VSDARQANDRWFAYGDWRPESENAPDAPKSAKSGGSEDDERPVLDRSQTSAPQQETQSNAPAVANSQTSASAPPAADDPNRPVLRRGKPKPQPEEPPEEKPKPGAVSEAKPKVVESAPPAKAAVVLAAISDAGGPDPHSFSYAWAPDEQQKLTKAITEIATAEVTHYAKSTPALRFAPTARFDQVSIRAFDLQYNNNPAVVFTARYAAVVPQPARPHAAKTSQPAPDFFFYVAVVGQTDLYGQMRKLFSSVTDSAHLDAFPRLELIDAVDAEGTGRGDLLFRALSGGTYSYQLYHVGPDALRKLFDSVGND